MINKIHVLLNTRPKEKSEFVFLKKREIKRYADDMDFFHRTLAFYVLDSGLRPSKERLKNLIMLKLQLTNEKKNGIPTR